MSNVLCPVCDGATRHKDGYTTCDTHGILPYDWVRGAITRERALDMMEKWGVEIKRKKVKRADDAAPAPKGTVADLLNQLKVAMNPADKRKLRAALRKAGHTGGLKS